MKRSFLVLMLSCTCSLVAGQTRVPVFISGEDGHKSYRIPAIIALPDGDLLAFAEGRVHGGADFGDINLVMKRSTDNGRHWSPLVTLVNRDSLQAGNPAPVIDLLDPLYPQGRVFLFYNTGNNHEAEVRKGNGLREVWYIASADGGRTWADAVNITGQVHRPNQPETNPAYDSHEDWRSYANTPGHAIQFTSGIYQGRIFVPANHSAGEPQPAFRDYAAHGFYSDDHGKTFAIGQSIPITGSNESTAAALADGSLLMNIRNQSGDIRARIIARSSTGGNRWDTTYFDMNLPDAVCQGSLLVIGKKKGKNILAFCNPADSIHRDNLTLRISYDEAGSWPKSVVIDKAPEGEERNHTAYSDLVMISKKKVGILYERKNYSEIVFTAVRW